MSEASYTEVAASISAASVYDGSVEGVLDEDRLKCNRCGRLFNSQRGLSLHQRKACARISLQACAEGEKGPVEPRRKGAGGEGRDPAPGGGGSKRKFRISGPLYSEVARCLEKRSAHGSLHRGTRSAAGTCARTAPARPSRQPSI